MGRPKESKKSLELKVRWEMEIVYHFRREDFHPKPSVDCVLIHFKRKAVLYIQWLCLFRCYQGLRRGKQ